MSCSNFVPPRRHLFPLALQRPVVTCLASSRRTTRGTESCGVGHSGGMAPGHAGASTCAGGWWYNRGESMEKPGGTLKKTSTSSQRSGEMVKQEKTCIKMCCHKVSNNQIAQYGKMNMGRNFPMDHRPPQLGSGDFAE